MRRLVTTILIWLYATAAVAQMDTLVLKDVTILGQLWTSYATGVKIHRLDPDTLTASQSLADLLQSNALAYLKTYGNGQLSTLNIRGTSANQNAIFWNGINSNVTSLGLTDFSLTPLALVDDVSLQYGAGSSLLGSDVIGGSVHLRSSPRKKNDLSLALTQGSFGLWGSRAKARYYSGKWTGATRLFYQTSENDFPYQNTTVPGSPTEKMEHAAFKQLGLSQDLWYEINDRHQLSAHLWYQSMDREIQPGLNTTQRDDQYDQTIRGLIQWSADYGDHNGTLKLAQLQDRIDFNGEISIMPRTYFSYEHEYVGHDNWSLRGGLNWQILSADIDAYQDEISENRQDLFVSLGWYPTPKLNLSANLRQSLVEGFDPPLTPSVGWSYLINSWLAWTGNLARSYRVPTLNDRYWRPGGNLDLRPESGSHAETGVEITHSTLKHEVSTYFGDISEWIIWLPQEGYWAPENIDEVEIFGLEYEGAWQVSSQFEVKASYAYNKSIRTAGATDTFEGKQLPYVPLHQFKSNFNYQHKWLSLGGNAQWISQRFTNADNSSSLDPFFMLGLSANAQVRQSWSFSIRANNLTNQDYQLLRNRPMPGRNYQITIQHNFDFN
ncbi:MAG: TonB-dependent receptor [Cyclobacteriaceae bacterium]